ncbi:M61 family peptidase [Fulvivirga maritima]|uniref:M61 family metallopeptidase n=1 Tax=Fulvivirga maritima TaxID=2904247 RepID=UPI001F26C743|nr:M61 family peptidase [Fulvivirga maritima]UII26619.1 M61 family peptidase [Fulvivirga maritima]
MKKLLLLALSLTLLIFYSHAGTKPQIHFTVSMADPASHTFHVEMICSHVKEDQLELKMPVWTPGYYQILDFPGNVKNFNASADGNTIDFTKKDKNTWLLATGKAKEIVISYDVVATKEFVAEPYLGSSRGYILPGGVFLYPENRIESAISIKINHPDYWPDIATGLSQGDNKDVFIADNYDVLYDSPILVGKLHSLPDFKLDGIPHYFSGYNMGDFDEQGLMDDLKKIIKTSTDLIGDIPYEQYTFIGIGPGRGGIEHLNSTSVSFSGNSLSDPNARLQTLFFLAHEYFHNFNVKRIRPIELGPFDYSDVNRTKMLWVSEGLSVYYEYMVVKRAELCSKEQLFKAFEGNINAYENDPGKTYQSIAEASYETWRDGPFGQTAEEEDRGISYYQKGPILGLLLDFKIRHETNNRNSLDDVMRDLYNTYYKGKKRGFTEEELRKTCEKYAETNLDEFFSYIYTTQPLDYDKYLGYAGLELTSKKKDNGAVEYTIEELTEKTDLQERIFKNWVSEQ